MPSLKTLLLFTVAALAITVTPGPSMLYVMSRSLAQGRMAGIFSALGLATGLLVHIIAASLGLSMIFVYSPFAYLLMKYLGALYLIYLGIRMLRSRNMFLDSAETSLTIKHSRIYGQGFLTEIFNPKTALFFLSFLPQFVDPLQGTPALQMCILGGILLVSAFCMDLFIAIMGSAVSNWLRSNPFIQKGQQWLAGMMLVTLGIRLAFSKRQ